MKEPLIVDFLEQFLAEHNLSNHPRVPSRPGSVRSFRSGRSLTPINVHSGAKPPGSPSSLTGAAAAANSSNHHHRLSVRLSQAELLEYSHHQQQRMNSVPTTPTSSSHSLKSQAVGLPPSPVRSTSPVVGLEGKLENGHRQQRLSREASLASLDAVLTNLWLSLYR